MCGISRLLDYSECQGHDLQLPSKTQASSDYPAMVVSVICLLTQKPPARYRVIDTQASLDYFATTNKTAFQEARSIWVEQELNSDRLKRRRQWSKSITIGSNAFLEKTQNQLKEKSIISCSEPSLPYTTLFDGSPPPRPASKKTK